MIPNGLYTFTNAAGEHRTFKIHTKKKDANFAPGQRIVSLLTGPDNENDYRGFGFVKNDGIKIWNKNFTPAFQWYARMVVAAANAIEQMIEMETPEAAICLQGRGYKVQVSKRCCVCNRTLTDPESIKLQIGPICREGMAA